MFMFPLINNTDKAFDDFCRRQMSGFAIVPERPLNIAATKIPSQPSLRVRLRAHALPIVATGVTTAAIGGLLWTTLPRHTQQQTPPSTPPATPTVVDTLSAANEEPQTISYTETEQVEDLTPANATTNTTTKTNRPKPAAVETTAPQPDTVATAAEPETPVVIKKVHRKRKSTVIVKDNQ